MAVKSNLNELKKNSIRFFVISGLMILVIIIGIILLIKMPSENVAVRDVKKDFIQFPKKDGIVIVNINGVIQFGQNESGFGLLPNEGLENVISRIKRYAKEKNIKGLVLRINSPGGTIGAVQELYNAIIEFKSQNKIVVASMADIAASGGYYIASAADKIVANPGTITGSIGVIIASPSFTGLFNKIGINYRVFKSGKFKDILSSFRDISKEERELIQGIVDDAFLQFFNAVKSGRKISEDKLRKYADGRIFTGRQAKEIGLVDHLGGLSDAIKLAGELAGLGAEPYIIREKINIWQQLFGMAEEKKSFHEKMLSQFFNNYVPVYYLYIF